MCHTIALSGAVSARIADEEFVLLQQQILLSQQCAQRFQWGYTMQSITWRENFKFFFDFVNP